MTNYIDLNVTNESKFKTTFSLINQDTKMEKKGLFNLTHISAVQNFLWLL